MFSNHGPEASQGNIDPLHSQIRQQRSHGSPVTEEIKESQDSGQTKVANQQLPQQSLGATECAGGSLVLKNWLWLCRPGEKFGWL